MAACVMWCFGGVRDKLVVVMFGVAGRGEAGGLVRQPRGSTYTPLCSFSNTYDILPPIMLCDFEEVHNVLQSIPCCLRRAAT